MCVGVKFRRSAILPWIFAVDNWIRGQQVWVRRRRRQQHRRGGRGSAQCRVQQRMNHDAWIKRYFRTQKSLAPVYTCHLCCVMWSDCEMWRTAGVSVYTSVDCQGTRFSGNRKKKGTSEQGNHYCSVQDEDRQEFQLLVDFQSSCCSH